MKYIILILISLASAPSIACSFANPFVEFEHTNEGTIIPNKPNFSVASIERGGKGDSAMCADAGILTLLAEPATKETGYIFSIVEGEFEDQLFYPEPLTRMAGSGEEGKYFFIWLDGNTTEQEAINITVKIVAVSKDGGLSQPQLSNVTHQGVKKSWWQLR